MNRYFALDQSSTNELRDALTNHPYSSLVLSTPDGKRWVVSQVSVAVVSSSDLGTILCLLEPSLVS